MRLLLVGCGGVARSFYLLNKRHEIAVLTKDKKRGMEFIPDAELIEFEVRQDKQNELKKLIKELDVDAIVNCAIPKVNEVLLRIAAKLGLNYIDSASEIKSGFEIEQFKFSQAFEKSGLVAFIDLGIQPGVSGLLVSKLIEKLGEENAKDVRITTFEEAIASKKELGLRLWNPRIAIEDVITSPTVLKDGKLKKVEPLSLSREIQVPNFGKRTAYVVCEEDVLLIHHAFPLVKNAIAMICGSFIEGFVKAREEGRLKEYAESLLENDISTLSPTELKRAIEKGELQDAFIFVNANVDARSTWAIFPSQSEVNKTQAGSTCVAYGTALVMTAAAKLVDKHEPGVYSGETMNKKCRDFILRFLREHNVKFLEQGKFMS